jgi:hypothetical protein
MRQLKKGSFRVLDIAADEYDRFRNAAVCTLLNVGTGAGFNTKAANTRAAINTATATAIMANNTFPMQNNTGSAVSFGHLFGRGGCSYAEAAKVSLDGYRRCVSLRGGVLRLAVSAAAVPTLPWDTPASRRRVRCQ